MNRDELLNRPMHTLDLTGRPHNILREQGVETIADLISFSPRDLLMLRSFGPACLLEVRLALGERGLALRDDPQADYFINGHAGRRPYWFNQIKDQIGG